MKKKILILEDARIGGQVKDALLELGAECSWLVGVKSLEAGKIVGFNPKLELEELDLACYELAFVDGFLYIAGLMGWDLLPELKKLMHTISTSSMGEIGAHEDCEKEQMLERAKLWLQSKEQKQG